MEEKDPKLIEAIDFFETMLESMPGDRTSLEFLVVAYEQVGALDKRRRCLIDLADALIKEQAFDNAKTIADHLKTFSDDSEVEAVIVRVEQALTKEATAPNPSSQYEEVSLDVEGDGSLSVPDPVIEVHAYSRAALSAEMDLVWMLKEKEILPRDVCEELIRALSEYPVTERPQLISAMVFLDERHPEWTDMVMAELQKISGMPAIPLELFDSQDLVLSGITSAYIKVRGAIPFAMMTDEFLIGVMNPLDTVLQADISSRLGTTCHFFLTHPRTCREMLESKLGV